MSFGGRPKSMSLGGWGEKGRARVTNEIYCSSSDIGWRDSENHYSVTDILFAQFIVALVLDGMTFVLRSFSLAKCATIQTKPLFMPLKLTP